MNSLSKLLLLFVGSLTAVAQSERPAPAEPLDRELPLDQPWNPPSIPVENARRPEVDAKKRVNDSNSFLKEREPEMNSEEYALYQKVVAILTSSPELAVKLLEGMMNEKEAPSPAFEFMLGNAYYTAGQPAKAETRYRSALTRFPSFLRAWSNLGILYYMTERYAEAVPVFSKAVSLGDREATTFGLLGFCLEKTGNLISAEMAYMQALGSDPKNINWKESLVRLYINQKQYGRAEPLVRTLIAEAPAEKRYWLMYAHVLLSERRKLKAIAVLEIAANGKVAGEDELALLGDLYAEQNLTAEAAGIYEHLLALHPESGESKLLRYAQVLTGAEKYRQASEVLKSLEGKLTPQGQLAFLQTKADLLAAQKRWPEARKELDALLKLVPLDGRALLSLGRAYAAEGDAAHATFAFESALRSPTTTYRASLELADIELKNRHYQKSAIYLEKALNLERTEAVANLLARVKTLAASETNSP